MSRAQAVCEEFCEEVEAGTRITTHPTRLFDSIEELKCTLELKHFTPLEERMIDVGYCCTQVQKDASRNKCLAWFEPITYD